MKVYIQSSPGRPCLVLAERYDDEYRVHHPDAGYSVWPAAQFENDHRELTAHERQLINMTTAELEVMGISDNVHALR